MRDREAIMLFGRNKDGKKKGKIITIYKTHNEAERDLFAKKLDKAGIWNATRTSAQARTTASFGSNFIDIQRFAGDRDADNRDFYIDVHPEDAQRAKDLLGPRCRVISTQLI